jgi:hypothetical protein
LGVHAKARNVFTAGSLTKEEDDSQINFILHDAMAGGVVLGPKNLIRVLISHAPLCFNGGGGLCRCRTLWRFSVKESRNSVDVWRVFILLLWAAFFAVGLFPEWVYDQARDLGRVAAQRALTNSSWLITFSWAGYLGWFTLLRCREAADSQAAASAKGVQVLLLGLTAFMPLRLENIAEVQYIPVPSFRWLVYGTACAKCIAWLYLVLVVLRYYYFSGHQTFSNMPAIFPSAHESCGRARSIQTVDSTDDANRNPCVSADARESVSSRANPCDKTD